MKKILLNLLSLGLGLTACSHSEEDYFTKASSYPASCQTDSSFIQFLNTYNLCVSSSAATIDSCLNTDLKNLNAGITKACRSEPATKTLLGKAFLKLIRSDLHGVTDAASQQKAIKTTAFWLTNYAEYYTSAGLPVDGDIVHFEKAFVDAIREDVNRQTSSDLQKQKAILDSFSATTKEDLSAAFLENRLVYLEQVIGALKTQSPAASADASAYMITNALSMAIETLLPRITYALAVHDLACATVQCRPGEMNDYDYVRTYAFLYAIATDNFNSTAFNGSMSAEVDRFRALVLANKDLISTSTRRMKSLQTVTGNGRSFFAGDFLLTLSNIATNYQRFQKTGYFNAANTQTLLFGFSQQSKNATDALLGIIKDQMTSSANLVRNNSDAYYNALRDALGKDLQLTEVKANKVINETLMDDLNSDLIGLRKAVADQDKGLADFYTQLQNLAKTNANAPSLKNKTKFDSIAITTITPADARYSIDEGIDDNTDISYLTARKYSLKKGQVLQLEVDGSWAPTCALKKTLEGLAIDISSLKIGPDGFIRMQEQGASHVDSVEHAKSFSTYHDSSSEAKACDSASNSLEAHGGLSATDEASGSGGGIGIGGKFDRSVTTCDGYTEGTRRSDTWTYASTDSTSFRDGASFQMGMKLPRSPFVNMPGGSLLAFSMPKGNTILGSRIRAQVVERRTSIQAPEDMDVLLIVNDCAEGNSSIGGGLTISGGTLTSAAGTLVDLMPAIAVETQKFVTQGDQLLKEGKDIGPQIQALKSAAFAAHTAEINDAESSAIFTFAMDYAASRLDRLVKIQEKTRDLRRMQLEVAKLASSDSLLSSEKALIQNRLKSLVDDFSLQLYGSELTNNAGDIQRYVLPLLNYLEVSRDRLRPSAEALAESVSFSHHPVNALNKFSSLIDEIKKVLALNDGLISTKPDDAFFAIKIPNPESGKDSALRIPTLDSNRSLAIWNGLFYNNGQDVSFNLGPNDLYGNFKFGLQCEMSKPSIVDMSLVFLTEENVFNKEELLTQNAAESFTMTMGSDMFFASPDQSLNFTLNKVTDGNIFGKLGFAAPTSFSGVATTLGQRQDHINTAEGFSPFTKYSVSPKNALQIREIIFKDNGTVLDAPACGEDELPGASCKQFPSKVTDIVLVYKLRFYGKNNPKAMSWIQACK